MSRRNTTAGHGSFASYRKLSLELLEDRRLLTLVAELVRDIRPGAVGSGPGGVDVNGTFFFSADDGATGSELWKSDGTETGTSLVKDIYPGEYCDENGYNCHGYSSAPSNLTNVNGTLFFSAGRKLWKSDGTSEGTIIVKDGLLSGLDFANFVNRSGTLFFLVDRELWKSDGTDAGTIRLSNVEAINEGTLAASGDSLFFSAKSDTPRIKRGFELWKSDGSVAGTVHVKDIIPGAVSSYTRYITDVGEQTLFLANLESGDTGLWKTDGTAAGTVLVKNIYPESTRFRYWPSFTPVGNALFFVGYDSSHGFELWKSDGTAAGTSLVKDINAGAARSDVYGHFRHVNGDGALFFTATDNVNGTELWKSDGTAEGTVLVKQIRPGAASSNPNFLVHLDGRLYFSADDDIHGDELWVSDGTDAGTYMVADILVGESGSAPTSLTAVGNTLFFSADDGIHGRELWKVVVEDETTPGDTNGDGTVNIDDLNNVRNHFGESGEAVLGDTSPFDGAVDVNDLNAVRNNFGAAQGAASRVDRREPQSVQRLSHGTFDRPFEIVLASAPRSSPKPSVSERAADVLFQSLAQGLPFGRATRRASSWFTSR